MVRRILLPLGLVAGLVGLIGPLGAVDGPRPKHWAFAPPHRTAPPPVRQTAWPRTVVDRFLLAGLEARGWTPAAEAPPGTLLRRASLDLTGLPPTPAEVDAFLADTAPDAYERALDRLLASPRFGERMAQDWLDAARFADTNGYQVDRDREMWAWRDWVVRAFNRNLPFDQFTVEQIAGDLLPGATLDQKIATGFHRNHMINEEGGIIPEEFLAEYCADRVETTATVWLGLTMNCARCHDHKYDPLTQKDFYGLLAFFHNVPESGVGDYGANIRRSTPPFLKLPAPAIEAALAGTRKELASAGQQLTNLLHELEIGRSAWEGQATAVHPKWGEPLILSPALGSPARPAAVTVGWAPLPEEASTNARITFRTRAAAAPITAIQLEWHFSRAAAAVSNSVLRIQEIQARPAASAAAGDSSTPPAKLTPIALANLTTAPVPSLNPAVDGKPESAWAVSVTNEVSRIGVFLLPVLPTDARSERGEVDWEIDLDTAEAHGAWRLRLRATETDPALLIPPEVATVLAQPAAQRTADATRQLEDFRKSRAPGHDALRERVASLNRKLDELDISIPITLVMSEMETPRPTHVLVRGSYQQPGAIVTAATPASLLPFAAGWPRNRLGLARWLVDPANPLTARVMVNRLWQSLFGIGLVRTAEDFGIQGEPPSHPELLDWLATEFIRTGWDVKAMIKLLVASATYRQDARVRPEMAIADPENRWLAHAPRYRLAVEAIRDQALAVSGLLVETSGGPSVRPYHPPGLYEQVVAGSSANTYVVGTGTELYRRTLYTYWKRSVPNPALLLFDMPFRETCTVRRTRTTTPLQALNLMNDPTYVEAARALAERMMRRETGLDARLRTGFRLALCREPRASEMAILRAGWQRAAAAFRKDPTGAAGLITIGASRPDAALDPAELAAFTTTASTLLNLDETISKQ